MSFRAASSRGLFLLALALIAPNASRAASEISNGSYETGPDPGSTMTLAAGSTVISGWTVTRAGVRYAGTAWTAAQGSRSIALNAADAGGISQTFASIRGAQYTLRFYMAGDAATSPALRT